MLSPVRRDSNFDATLCPTAIAMARMKIQIAGTVEASGPAHMSPSTCRAVSAALQYQEVGSQSGLRQDARSVRMKYRCVSFSGAASVAEPPGDELRRFLVGHRPWQRSGFPSWKSRQRAQGKQGGRE